jgi:hypothetical protein
VDGSPVETHPIAFKARAKNEIDVQTLAVELRNLGYEVREVGKTWWPPLRKWQLIALTQPMPITRQSTEQWVRETATLLSRYNVVLGVWAPAEKKPAPLDGQR